ncbi:LysR family transcriptional regulator [Cupriavidus necator]
MDVELARTFLQVVRSGSLLAVADKLHVTQTAVTARLKSLESQLNCRLFDRNKAGARLTPDGQRFFRYASQLVQTWQAPAVRWQRLFSDARGAELPGQPGAGACGGGVRILLVFLVCPKTPRVQRRTP